MTSWHCTPRNAKASQLAACLQSILQLLRNLRPDSNNLFGGTMRHTAFRLGATNFERAIDLCWFCFKIPWSLVNYSINPLINSLMHYQLVTSAWWVVIYKYIYIYTAHIKGYGKLTGNSPGPVVWEFWLNEVQWDDDTLPKRSRMFLDNADQQRVPYLFTVSLTN